MKQVIGGALTNHLPKRWRWLLIIEMEQFYLVGIKILSKACNDLFKMAAIMHRVGDMQSGLPEFSGMERVTQDHAIEHINIL